jgi:hypothetical protein
MRMGWIQIFKKTKRYKILRKIGDIIRKKPNAVHAPERTMKIMFKGFLQYIRIFHLPLQTAKAHISTYYRDLRRCNNDSYQEAKQIMRDVYVKIRKQKLVKVTIDGIFIGVRGKTFEHASKMYSGNKQDKGKLGYTLVTCFDTINKTPIDFGVPLIHEFNAASKLLKSALALEEEGKITITLFVLDALYLSKELLDLVSKHRFILRARAYEWLLKHVDEKQKKGCKEIVLRGHIVMLHWRPSKEKEEKLCLLITNVTCKRIWWLYGHHKQMIENYHDDLKNKMGIRKLPSHKFYSILVYFCILLLIYMLARAVLLDINMNTLSCKTVLLVASQSSSEESFFRNLYMLGRRKPG